MPRSGSCRAFVMRCIRLPVAFWRNSRLKGRSDGQSDIASAAVRPRKSCASPTDVDAVFVTSPDALHREHVELALHCGKPVLCEKPLGMDPAECERMISAAAAAGLPLGVAQVFRFEESVNCIRKLSRLRRTGRDQGRAGGVRLSRPGIGAHLDHRPRLACGGPTADVGVHCFDALRYILRTRRRR